MRIERLSLDASEAFLLLVAGRKLQNVTDTHLRDSQLFGSKKIALSFYVRNFPY
jgi:hypothetical protein